MPLASLKLTVTLFALALLLVLAGTLAQVEADIWDAVGRYFRSWYCWLELRTFYPMFRMFPDFAEKVRDVSPRIGIWFPGGLTIGSLMFANLLAAHALRFKLQATGLRLISGCVATAVGALSTLMIIKSGHNESGLQEASVSWDGLWNGLRWLVGVMVVLNAAAIFIRRRQNTAEALILTGTLGVLAAALGWLIFGAGQPFSAPTMRILWQLLKAESAALLLVPGFVLLFRKRAGIVLLHVGVGLVMVNEIVVATTHVETRMSFFEGQTVNYSEDIRQTDLVLIGGPDPQFDDVITVPVSRLAAVAGSDQKISDELLPFDIQVVDFMKNSRPSASVESGNPATTGAGLDMSVKSVPPVAGTDSDGGIDLHSAYIRLFDRKTGAELGTYLASVWPDLEPNSGIRPNLVSDSDNADWRISMRFRRYEKPYSVTLIDTIRTDYVGTATPMDYRSIVRLVDPSRNVDLERPIWMNNPLRYAGDTFYQSGHMVAGGREQSVLSVVQNTGWMIPYVSCMVVGTGMLMQFWLTLVRFLGRSRTRTQAVRQDSLIEKLFPWGMALVMALYFVSKARMPSYPDGTPDLNQFGKLPVIYEGRSQPLDTVARNSLRILTGRDSFYSPDRTKKVAAIEWMFDLMTDMKRANRHRVIKIDHPQIRDALKLSLREGHCYSMDEIQENLIELKDDLESAQQKDPKDRTAEERKLFDLLNKVELYRTLGLALAVPEINQSSFEEDLQFAVTMGIELQRKQAPRLVPPINGIPQLENEWLVVPLAASIMAVPRESTGLDIAPARLMVEILAAGSGDGTSNGTEFNRKVKEYQNWLKDYEQTLKKDPPKDARVQTLNLPRTGFEAFFNQFAPFWYATFTYLFAFVLAAAALLGWSRPLNRAAFFVIVTTLVVHTFALEGRIYISGRPPVTNLYSSAVFIGWGCVIMGLIFESLYKLGIGNLLASVLGAATLGISTVLETDGDTFKVLQAVLDTQFWLATHVTCITLGYSTTFLAGTLGLVYVLAGLLTPWLGSPDPQAADQKLSSPLGKELARMIYGTVCFGIFFSFVGTVLGGLWADDSWGRFWGWDPKENGALMIVLWNALLLHARWGRLVDDRGLAVLAIGGNIVTSWSWFGVNELGVGLHSYGFTEGVWAALCLFWVSQAGIMGAGLIPRRYWRSFRKQQTAA